MLLVEALTSNVTANSLGRATITFLGHIKRVHRSLPSSYINARRGVFQVKKPDKLDLGNSPITPGKGKLA
jgi:hypothetical protein